MVRMLVLWLLSERPAHGYEIKKALADDATAFWFSVDDASIYSALRTLTKHGYTRELGTEQEGRRPPRMRYAITPAGRNYYRELLIEALATPALPVAAVDVALAARGDLNSGDVSQALSQRAKALDELLAGITAAERGAPSPEIASRNRAILEAERRWLSNLDHATIT